MFYPTKDDLFGYNLFGYYLLESNKYFNWIKKFSNNLPKKFCFEHPKMVNLDTKIFYRSNQTILLNEPKSGRTNWIICFIRPNCIQINNLWLQGTNSLFKSTKTLSIYIFFILVLCSYVFLFFNLRDDLTCSFINGLFLSNLHFYILIMDEKVLVLCQKWLSKF